ncbi:MAG TPA: zinc ABC transporter substrate-binding protein [Nakamurella sp.]|nr:zinc ABC transporter substrate-binding protein [Nakamurella sp.]
MIVRRAGQALLSVAVTAVLAACGSSGNGSSAGDGAGGGPVDGSTTPISVVTSTNVWGDVVSQIGGQYATVRPLVTDPSADPHSFEPSAQAQLAVSKAELIVTNGGGYDEWMTTLIDASGSVAPVIDAVDLFGSGPATPATATPATATPATATPATATPATAAPATAAPATATPTPATPASATTGSAAHDEPFNEHVWYDLPTVDAVAQRVADELSDLRPEQAGDFQANADAFADGITGLTTKVQAIKAAHDGTGIAVTEPVPLYLTEAAGLVDKTPERFSQAIEEGTDVPPTVLKDTLALFTGGQVAALVYNSQTASPETETVLNAAKQADIAVVPVAETLPENKDYLSWMGETITALATALDH